MEKFFGIQVTSRRLRQTPSEMPREASGEATEDGGEKEVFYGGEGKIAKLESPA